MKLEISRIEELKQENERLEKLEHETVKQAKEQYGRDFNDWYLHCREILHDIDEQRRENETMMTIIKATNINVGDGISLSPYTDWDAYTVIERRDTPKGFVLIIQEDKAIRTDNNGMSDTQSYRFERDENGRTATVKWNAKKQWFTCDGYKVALGRHAYYDYSF